MLQFSLSEINAMNNFKFPTYSAIKINDDFSLIMILTIRIIIIAVGIARGQVYCCGKLNTIKIRSMWININKL